MIEYISQNSITIGLGFLLGNLSMWFIWRFFFNFVYQDDNIDDKIDKLENKIDEISNHIGVQKSNNNLENKN
jgi:hypothetical protein